MEDNDSPPPSSSRVPNLKFKRNNSIDRFMDRFEREERRAEKMARRNQKQQQRDWDE
jgi:hypothetical protein